MPREAEKEAAIIYFENKFWHWNIITWRHIYTPKIWLHEDLYTYVYTVLHIIIYFIIHVGNSQPGFVGKISMTSRRWHSFWMSHVSPVSVISLVWHSDIVLSSWIEPILFLATYIAVTCAFISFPKVSYSSVLPVAYSFACIVLLGLLFFSLLRDFFVPPGNWTLISPAAILWHTFRCCSLTKRTSGPYHDRHVYH